MSALGLITAEQLGHILGGVSGRAVMDLRRTYDWPHVRVGRLVRWTPEQVEQIVRQHTVIPGDEGPTVVTVDGLTARSARRAS